METTFSGNIVRDPIVNTTDKGSVLNFTVAVNYRRMVNGEWQDNGTDYVECAYWSDNAKLILKKLAKGERMIVTGETRTRKYEDSEGIQRQSLYCRVSDFGKSLRFAGGTNNNAPSPEQKNRNTKN